MLKRAVVAGVVLGGMALGQSASEGKVFNPGGGVTNPRVEYKTEAEYTEEARRAGVSGFVVLSLRVGPDGAPRHIKVMRPVGFGLDEKALEAVKQWHFAPGYKDGQPVTVAAVAEVNFRLLTRNVPSTRLRFTLPPGLSRPELVKGHVPDAPKRAKAKGLSQNN